MWKVGSPLVSLQYLHLTYIEIQLEIYHFEPGNEILSVKVQHKKYFLEKLYTKCDGEANPKPFNKKPKLSISLDQHSEMLYNLF